MTPADGITQHDLPVDLSDEQQQRLINWGDAALRAYLDAPPALPKSFPYPQVGV